MQEKACQSIMQVKACRSIMQQVKAAARHMQEKVTHAEEGDTCRRNEG